MLAVGDNVEIWSVVEDWENGHEYGELVTKFVGHTGDVVSAVFSPDGKKILTGSTDGTAKLWNIGEINLRSFREYAAGDDAGGMFLDEKLSHDRENSIVNDEWFIDYVRDRGWKELQPTSEIGEIAFSPPPEKRYLLLITTEAYRPAELYLKEGSQLLSPIPLESKWSLGSPPQFSRNGEFVLIDGEEIYPTPEGIYCWLQNAPIAPLSERDREEFGLGPVPEQICSSG
jgi:WD40 repeat protein